MSEKLPNLTGCNSPEMYKCAHPAPYPEIRVVRQNPQYANLLLEDYTGQASELTAITQYNYHHFMLEEENEEAAALLECIALVEMHHLEILAETILALGGDPRYRTIKANGEGSYWNPSYVYYGSELCDRIAADIASEWAAVVNYRKHQQMINDPYVKKILERIILDELYHIELFHKVVKKYCRSFLKRDQFNLSTKDTP
mgnify:CR=1 FL=1|jgi:bacterioferritin